MTPWLSNITVMLQVAKWRNKGEHCHVYRGVGDGSSCNVKKPCHIIPAPSVRRGTPPPLFPVLPPGKRPPADITVVLQVE